MRTKFFNLFLTFCFILLQSVSVAQANLQVLPPTTSLLKQSSNLLGLKLNAFDPYELDFFYAQGAQIDDQSAQLEAEELTRYFLTALAVPAEDMWVNLSPYEPERTIPAILAKTDVGQQLLEQDYLLKQLTASLLDPQSVTGKKFWNQINEMNSIAVFSDELVAESIHKIWIVPNTAKVYQHDNAVFIAESSLKIMLEQDLFAAEEKQASAPMTQQINVLTETMKAQIIPLIEKKVNISPEFAPLRQIYHGVVLAKWFKENLPQNLLNQAFANQQELQSLLTVNDQAHTEVYQRYLALFQQPGKTDQRVHQFFNETTQEFVKQQVFTGGAEFIDAGVLPDDNPLQAVEKVAGRRVSGLTTRVATTEADPMRRLTLLAAIGFCLTGACGGSATEPIDEPEPAEFERIVLQIFSQEFWEDKNSEEGVEIFLTKGITRTELFNLIDEFETSFRSLELVIEFQADDLRFVGRNREIGLQFIIFDDDGNRRFILPQFDTSRSRIIPETGDRPGTGKIVLPLSHFIRFMPAGFNWTVFTLSSSEENSDPNKLRAGDILQVYIDFASVGNIDPVGGILFDANRINLQGSDSSQMSYLKFPQSFADGFTLMPVYQPLQPVDYPTELGLQKMPLLHRESESSADFI